MNLERPKQKWPDPDWVVQERELAELIVKDHHLDFFVNDLGYTKHMAIHDAIKPILAKHVAHYVRSYATHFVETYPKAP